MGRFLVNSKGLAVAVVHLTSDRTGTSIEKRVRQLRLIDEWFNRSMYLEFGHMRFACLRAVSVASN